MSKIEFYRTAAFASVLAGVLIVTNPAGAQEARQPIEPATPFVSSAELVTPPGALPDLEDVGVSDQALDDFSGKGTNTSVAITDQDLTAISSGNSITAAAVSSGAISLSDNALSGFGGVGNFLMNTGHNNSLQSNVSVTIIVTQ